MTRLDWSWRLETWPFAQPYRFAGHTWTSIDLFVASVTDGENVGIGEAAGIYYRDDTPAKMENAVATALARLPSPLTPESLRECMPPAGLRNALDCALWDLRAKQARKPVWQLAGLEPPRALTSVFTLSIDEPSRMARHARDQAQFRAFKLKIAGDADDIARVLAVRDARPDVWIGIDANQSLDMRRLQALLPHLESARVQMLEQPLPVGCEAQLDGLGSPVPLAADESVQTCAELDGLQGRFDIVNIKLDKSGGLTEALHMVDAARRLGLKIMVGNMLGTSRAMAPGFLIGQHCEVVDLDGPLLIGSDVQPGLDYSDGSVWCDETVWGSP